MNTPRTAKWEKKEIKIIMNKEKVIIGGKETSWII